MSGILRLLLLTFYAFILNGQLERDIVERDRGVAAASVCYQVRYMMLAAQLI